MSAVDDDAEAWRLIAATEPVAESWDELFRRVTNQQLVVERNWCCLCMQHLEPTDPPTYGSRVCQSCFDEYGLAEFCGGE